MSYVDTFVFMGGRIEYNLRPQVKEKLSYDQLTEIAESVKGTLIKKISSEIDIFVFMQGRIEYNIIQNTLSHSELTEIAEEVKTTVNSEIKNKVN